MDQSGKYQTIEFLRYDDGQSSENTNPDQDAPNRSMSSLSSSPPREFDVNSDAQYVPIFEEDVCSENNFDPSSLASSLSLRSEPDPATSALVFETRSCRLIRCPSCDKPMRTYYCSKCIQKGHFVTIGQPPKEDDLTIERLRDMRMIQQTNSLNQPDEQTIFEETLRSKLRGIIRKNDALKDIYKERKEKLDETKKLLAETKHQVDMDKKANKSLENKIELIKRFVTSRKASVKKRLDAENELLDEMKQHVSRRVYQVTQDVFPIEEINLLDQNNSFINLETSPLLTFSDGSHHQIEQQTAYSIIEPWLPSDGDYSAYSLWVNDNLDHIPASATDLTERNSAYRIGAALGYTCQLVQNLASYLDVILPARMSLDTFNREVLNDTHFSFNVAKLNTNVIHLCMSQGVDISLLNSQRTIKNIILLLNMNISDLGRKPILEIDDEEAAQKIEDQLNQSLSLIQDEYYDFSRFVDDDDNGSDSDWEISDTMNPSEIQLAIDRSVQQDSYISRLPLRLFTSLWSN